MNEDITRRGFISGVIGSSLASGCLESDKSDESDEVTMNELLENPEEYEEDEITVKGIPEYEGEVTYTIVMYNPAIRMPSPMPTSDHTYRLRSEFGDEDIPFRTDSEVDFLQNLEEGESYEKEIEVTGFFEEVEKDDEKTYMIREATVEE